MPAHGGHGPVQPLQRNAREPFGQAGMRQDPRFRAPRNGSHGAHAQRTQLGRVIPAAPAAWTAVPVPVPVVRAVRAVPVVLGARIGPACACACAYKATTASLDDVSPLRGGCCGPFRCGLFLGIAPTVPLGVHSRPARRHVRRRL